MFEVNEIDKILQRIRSRHERQAKALADSARELDTWENLRADKLREENKGKAK